MMRGVVIGCGLWLISAGALAQTIVAAPAEIRTTQVGGFTVTEGDIADKPYRVLGNVRAAFGRSETFMKPASRDRADAKMRKAAAKLGADAIVRVKYRDSSKGLGSLTAEGVAIAFEPNQ